MSDAEDTGQQTVADPEESNQESHLKSIRDARDRARDTYAEIQDESIPKSEAAAFYRACVQGYVEELEGLLWKYDFEDSDFSVDYWEEKELGPFTISPPQELLDLQNRRGVTVIGEATLSSRRYPISGLKGYLETAEKCPVQEKFALPVRQRHKGQRTVQSVVSTEMPIEVSKNAYRALNRFVAEIGLGAEIETKEHRSDVTDEVLEEVEKWRKQNLQ